MKTSESAPPGRVTVLCGLESCGKSALFRQLTGQATGDEANYRGSTVVARSAPMLDGGGVLVDLPGIRSRDDSATTQLALARADAAETVLLVARGTHAPVELTTLVRELTPALRARNAALVLTFEDKAAPNLTRLSAHYEALFGVPVVQVNARDMSDSGRASVMNAIRCAAPLRLPSFEPPAAAAAIAAPDMPVINPQRTLYEHPFFGPIAAVLTILLLFAGPVTLAYLFSEALQPLVDALLIDPLTLALQSLLAATPLLHFLLVGDYGLITLGWYSFLWAFPVVLLVGISVALTEETGLKDRVTAALDPALRRIGLNGRDLIPVLSGYGCNVVAVFQTRACSACTRKACVSLIAFGSACSYQIGATLSLFGSAGAPGLFLPYLLLLFVTGALHTRVWHPRLPDSTALPLAERAFLQRPSWRALLWRVRTVVAQFLKQAMPVFLLICAAATLMQYAGLMDVIAALAAPALAALGLPSAVAPAVIFSIVRKDGLLVLNQGEGALLAQMGAGQIFLLVWLASTLTACLVTLWTVRRELGWRFAAAVAGRQAATSLASTALLALVIRGAGA